MKEIEIKLRISDEFSLRRALVKIADFNKEYIKKDEYYIKDDFVVRIREDYPETYVTYKTRKIENSVEVNQENEMTVSSKKIFLDLLKEMGYKEYYKKTKTGYSFKTIEGIIFDVSKVNDLGTFLEIEKVVEDEIDTSKVINELKSIMTQLNLSEEQIETKSYAKLILEKN